MSNKTKGSHKKKYETLDIVSGAAKLLVYLAPAKWKMAGNQQNYQHYQSHRNHQKKKIS